MRSADGSAEVSIGMPRKSPKNRVARLIWENHACSFWLRTALMAPCGCGRYSYGLSNHGLDGYGLSSYGIATCPGQSGLRSDATGVVKFWFCCTVSSTSPRFDGCHIIGISASPTACPLRGYGRAVGDADTEPIQALNSSGSAAQCPQPRHASTAAMYAVMAPYSYGPI